MTIHLHSFDSQPKGILKDDINKLKDDINKQEKIEYRKTLPYDAMGDFSNITIDRLPSEPINRLNELKAHDTMKKLDSLIERMTGFSCVAEYNHYRNIGR
jgi:uncharacterized protein with von Willebrand factor type A (vWA) domain